MPKSDEINYFAETTFRNARKRFGILTDDRRRHMYVLGKTGMGKSVLEENMAIQDILAGHGVGVVDPHGEFADRILDFVPPSRINDVIYFNPADFDFPIAFNVMEKVKPEYRHLIASGLMGVFKKIWPDVWSARMEYILNNAILALLEYSGSTLLGINRMLSDKEYRAKVVDNITDPVVKAFWVTEFARYTQRLESEATASIQNKVGQFISASLIRNIIGQTKSAVDMRKVMDEEKILIMNLSKGLIGEDNSRLMGALLITKLQLAAMSRVDIPEEKRKDFYLYVDEFQNFATESFANILSEARKYRLSLILAHQYITQMEETVRDAVFGNVGTLVSFRVGAEDAEFLEKEFAPEFMATDIVNLAKYNVYLKLMVNGVAGHAFSAQTLPPFPKPEKNNREKIIKVSRERYGTPRKEVEEKIAKWSGAFSESFVPPSEPPKLYEATCSVCGKKTRVVFEPDPKRPIYCEKCLKEIREKRSQGQRPSARNDSYGDARQHSFGEADGGQAGGPSSRQSGFGHAGESARDVSHSDRKEFTRDLVRETNDSRGNFFDGRKNREEDRGGPAGNASRSDAGWRRDQAEGRDARTVGVSLEESAKKPPTYFHPSRSAAAPDIQSNNAKPARNVAHSDAGGPVRRSLGEGGPLPRQSGFGHAGGPQKERAKVNLEDLRKTLADSLGGVRNNDEEKKINASIFQKTGDVEQAPTPEENSKRILKPGDKIQF